MRSTLAWLIIVLCDALASVCSSFARRYVLPIVLLFVVVLGLTGKSYAAAPTSSVTIVVVPSPVPTGQAAYTASVLSDSPSVFYPLADTSGTVMSDASGNSRNGTYVGSPTFSNSGPFAGALGVSFSGTSQYATLPISLPAPPFTVEFWIEPSASGSGLPILAEKNPIASPNTGFAFVADGGYFKLFFGNGSSFVGSGAVGSVPIGSWTHCAFTVSSAGAGTLYVNGTSTWTISTSTAVLDTATLLSIARYASGSSTEYPGKVSNLAVYPTQLSATRLLAHIAAGTATPPPPPTTRSQFVGAFYRASSNPPYGIFANNSPNVMPSPYPTPGSVYTGSTGYCDHVESNGYSIDTGYLADPTKLSDMVNLGAKFSRMTISSFFMDNTHASGSYNWTLLDSGICNSYIKNGVTPIIGIENGPVNYDSTPGTFSPQQQPDYESSTDFAGWCGAVAAHTAAAFPGVTKFSIPGNEINDNPAPSDFPGGNSQIISYTKACYQAIKAADPSSFVYGFELNMDASLNPANFVSTMEAGGCGPGTCYDGISLHFSFAYPIPSNSAPCYPNSGGTYSMQCITDVINASGNSSLHVLIGEMVYPVPNDVPSEAVKATTTVQAYTLMSNNPLVDGVVYANVDECALYTSGYFEGGCLIDTSGNQLPAYGALQTLAKTYFQ